MAKKKRVTIQLDEDMHALISKLADLREQSFSKTIHEYLDVGRESLRATANAIEAVKSLSEAERDLVREKLDHLAAMAEAAAASLIDAQEDAAVDLIKKAHELEFSAHHLFAEAGEARAKAGGDRPAAKGDEDPRPSNTGVPVPHDGGSE